MLTTITSYRLNQKLPVSEPCRIALSRFPHEAIEHQRRVPGRDVSRNHSTQSGFEHLRMRSTRVSSSVTSPPHRPTAHATRRRVDLHLDPAGPEQRPLAASRQHGVHAMPGGRRAGIGEQGAQGLARLTQRAPGASAGASNPCRRGRSGRRPRRGAGRDLAAVDPGRVEQVEGERLPEQRARIGDGHVTSIGLQSGDSSRVCDRTRASRSSKVITVACATSAAEQDAAVRELQAGLGWQPGEAVAASAGRPISLSAERLDRALRGGQPALPSRPGEDLGERDRAAGERRARARDEAIERSMACCASCSSNSAMRTLASRTITPASRRAAARGSRAR